MLLILLLRAAAAASPDPMAVRMLSQHTARLDNPELGIAFVSECVSEFWSARRLLGKDPSEPPCDGAVRGRQVTEVKKA